MEIKYKFYNQDKFEYHYIYEILKERFTFNEEDHGAYIKDVIKVLIENEKNGEPFIDIDNQQIVSGILNEEWPNEHIKILSETGLINQRNSPIVLSRRKLSWQKWVKKIEKLTNTLISKNDSDINKDLKINSSKNSTNKDIYKIFQYYNLVLLQGGPGTGKTTLIINLMLKYLDHHPDLNIGLAAPTGKAVARLKESINDQKISTNRNKIDRLECQTLHSWIYNLKNKSSKLKYKLSELDFIIIDEMSMVGFDLIQSIIDNLARDCKILLVGDANQLSPINSCSIWNHIFTNLDKSLFEKCTINLTKSYRNSGDIEILSKRIFNKILGSSHKEIILDSLNNEKSNLKVLWENHKNIPKGLILEINNNLRLLKTSIYQLSQKDHIFNKDIVNLIDVEKELISNVFINLNSHMILCEKNIGIWGVKEINKIFIKQSEPYDYQNLDEGLPIMCTENNNELGISNGDIGILIGSKKTRRFLFRKFNKRNEPIVALIDPSKLESVIPAIAITIHKAQGSESNKVSILWTNKTCKTDFEESHTRCRNQILFRDSFERRMFYTAITRAKERLNLYILR